MVSLQRVGRRPHGIDGRVTRRLCLIASRLGGGSRDLSSVPRALAGLPKALALLTEGLEGVTIVVANRATLLAQTSELFGRSPRRLGRRAQAFRVFARLGWGNVIVCHGYSPHIMREEASPVCAVVNICDREHPTIAPPYDRP